MYQIRDLSFLLDHHGPGHLRASPFLQVLVEYTDDELRETLKVATTGKLGSSDAILAKGLKYKEATWVGGDMWVSTKTPTGRKAENHHSEVMSIEAYRHRSYK